MTIALKDSNEINWLDLTYSLLFVGVAFWSLTLGEFAFVVEPDFFVTVVW